MSVIDYAIRRNCDINNEPEDMRYWAAYLDGARAQRKEDEALFNFQPISELPDAPYYGDKYLVRVQLTHGGMLRDRYEYRICNYRSVKAYNKYFDGLKEGDVVTHFMPLPMTDEDKEKENSESRAYFVHARAGTSC